MLREYLIVAAKCKLTTRADRLGVKVTYVCQTSETGINIRILLAALRRFYDYLILNDGYGHANPLLQEEMDQIRTDLRNGYRHAVRTAEGRDPMPSVSGVDPPFGIRLSANFFRCVDREWIPRTIDDPDFPHLVYSAGKDYGWGLRELCVVRMLFESGARISEILDLSALDWSGSQFMNQFAARNKGSFGIRTKRLVVSSATAKLCHRYFDNDIEGRRAHDRQGLALNDLAKLDDETLGKVPLFLTDRGTPMRAKVFRRGHWTPALRAAGIHASPHLARHWFVTNALRMIEKTSKDENEIVRRKAELVQYMGWRTAERTLRAYEHVTRDATFVTTTLTTIHAAMKKREDAIKRDPAVLSQYQPVQQSNAGVREDPDLALLTGPMTSQEIAARIQADLGPTWPRNRTLPTDVLTPLCEALWEEGVIPNRRIVQRCLPGWNEHAMGPGVVAWRLQKGMPQQGVRGPRAVPTNLTELAKVVSPVIARAPQTCFDPANDNRWLTPSLPVLAYLGRIENQSVRNAMALFAILRADRQQFSMRNQISNFAYIMRRVMTEQSIEDVSSIDANDLLFRIHVGEVGKGLTDHQRRTLIGQWSAVRNVFEEYAEKLTAEQFAGISRFFIKPLTDRRKLARHTPWAGVHREQQERVKNKTDAVQQQFYRVRYLAGIRCNQARRVYAAVKEAIAFVQKTQRSYPHEFSYEETVQTPSGRAVRQRVELTLWDAVSVREHAIGLGYAEAPDTTRQRRWREGRYSEARVTHYVEYNATVTLERTCAAEPFWFLGLFRHRVFRRVEARGDSDLADKRERFDRKWGYPSLIPWSDDGILSLGSADYRPLDYLQAQEGHEFLPYEGIYAAALFGGLMIRMGTITGARGGEIQQIAQSPECFKQLDNVGPKAATRWLLRMIPKGRKDRADYYIDEDTKNHLVELIRFQCERLGATVLPVVNSEYGKTPPDRYVLQWNGHGVDLAVLNTLIRFLLHGVLFQAMDGTVVQLTSHLLRHAFANEMAELKVSVDIIASLLHQRDKTVTKYYARPTPTQVLRAAEMIFVDRIDVGAEALRSPDEIGRMLKDAEGKLGALTEVFGGTCVVANMCPAKFACVGCAGNAPDPSKRYQIQQKLDWAKEQVGYAVREHLPAEEVKLGQLIADCKLVMEEMDLIEAARADRSQDVEVQHGRNSR